MQFNDATFNRANNSPQRSYEISQQQQPWQPKVGSNRPKGLATSADALLTKAIMTALKAKEKRICQT